MQRGVPRFSAVVTACAALVVIDAAAARDAQAQPPPPGSTVTPPRVLTHVDAPYPATLMATGRHADVLLLVTIDAEGHVTKVDIEQSSGFAEVDAVAADTVRRWTFSPAIVAGRAASSRIRVPLHFAPPEPPPPPRPPSAAAAASEPEAPVVLATTPPSSPADSAPPEVVHVRGHVPTPSRGASDYTITVGELGRVPRRGASELLKLAPGILLTNVGGEGHPDQVFLRGFDAREGQDIEFSVGGVPINEAGNLHGNGFADLHFIIPEVVESLRVVEGPFDPRQGNFAVAGSANYELGLARRGLTAKYMRGSFGTERMLLTWGPRDANAHTFGAVELFTTDGFGQNRDARRGTAMGQYEGRLGDAGYYRVTATGYSNDFKSAGLLREDDVQSGRRGFFDTYDRRQGGVSSRYSLAGDLSYKSGDTVYRQSVFLILRDIQTRENFTGFLLDVQKPLQSPHAQRGDLIERSAEETTIGARGSGRFRGRAFGQMQEVELGYFARGDRVNANQFRIESATGFPYLREFDLDAKLGNIGLYGDLNVRTLPWLTFRGGARADLFTYDVFDRCAAKDVRQPSRANPPGDASCLSQQDQGRYREPTQRTSTASTKVMPRAAVLVGPFSDVTFSAAYGIGARSIDPIFINQDLRTPFATIEAAEAGASFARTLRTFDLNVRSVFFQTHVDRDLIFSETAGRNTLANGTTRTGWAGSVRATGHFFDQSASLTLVRSTFDDTNLLIPYVPDVVFRSDTALFADLPFRIDGERVRGALGSGVTFVGRRALPFGQRSGTIFTVDASATASWRIFELGLVATNLFDNRYRLAEYNFASNFGSQSQPTLVPARHFSAGMPQAFYVTLSATVGGT